MRATIASTTICIQEKISSIIYNAQKIAPPINTVSADITRKKIIFFKSGLVKNAMEKQTKLAIITPNMNISISTSIPANVSTKKAATSPENTTSTVFFIPPPFFKKTCCLLNAVNL